MEQVQPRVSRQEQLTEMLFWPLWWVTLALQVLDAASIALAGHLGAAEANGVVLRLEARYGLLGAVAFKTLTVAALLGLILGWYQVGRVWRIRMLAALCLLFVAGLALYSAVVLWSNLRVVLH